jgi:hypothetical protein
MECLANTQQLCAQYLNPSEPLSWFRYVACSSEEFWNLPSMEILQRCSSQNGLNSTAIQECSTDGRGRQLLQTSVQVTAMKGIQTSCTVFISGKPRCVHDGVWKDCIGGSEEVDFKRSICRDYEAATGQSFEKCTRV